MKEHQAETVDFAALLLKACRSLPLDCDLLSPYGLTYSPDSVHFFVEHVPEEGRTITYKVKIDRISG
jgi:hypothetical protein